jgi:GT2 family glycosyltransferase
MKISILIPTKNRLPILRETLHNIYYVNKLPKEDFEVIVSNDGDEDLSILYDEFPFDNFKIVKNTHKHGAAGNRNNAADYAQYEILQFIDDDILINSNTLTRVINRHSHYGKILLISNLFFSETYLELARKTTFGRYKLTTLSDFWENIKKINKLDDDGLYKINISMAGTLSIKKNDFELNGGYNENFNYAGWEDAEFNHRAILNGFDLLFDENNICFHNEIDRLNLESWLARQRADTYGIVIMCKYFPQFKSYSSWYTNTTLKIEDPWDIKNLKLKKIFCSLPPVYNFFHFLAINGEKMKLPDAFLFRIYNALWLGATYRSFRESYKEIFKKEKA